MSNLSSRARRESNPQPSASKAGGSESPSLTHRYAGAVADLARRRAGIHRLAVAIASGAVRPPAWMRGAR